MPIGITNGTNTSMAFIEKVTNVSSYPELAINVNTYLFGGYLYFILLFVLWVILFVTNYKTSQEFMKSIMYSGAIVSVISLLLRAVYVVNDGWKGLLTDSQLWAFPLITVLVAMIIWFNKD